MTHEKCCMSLGVPSHCAEICSEHCESHNATNKEKEICEDYLKISTAICCK